MDRVKMNFYLELLEIYKNDNFSWGHFAWTTWWTWHYVSNLLLFYLQKMSLSKTKSELLLPVHQLCIRIRKKWKIWIFEIHYASYILNSKVKFKNHIFQYCLILALLIKKFKLISSPLCINFSSDKLKGVILL